MGCENAVENLKDVPDVIYHIGAWGKEPMIVIVGENPVEVAKMAICIAKLYLNTIDKF